MKKKRSFRYTMVEMLVVIVLATILFSIGIPAFLTMIRGNAMTIAVRELSACLQGARSHAATNNTYTAVLFLANELDSVDKSKGYSFYRVCTVINVTEKWTFEGWIEGEDWKQLPSGVLMGQKSDSDPPKPYEFQNGINVEGVDLQEFSDDTYKSVKVIRALIFKPNGQTVNTGLSIPLFHERNLNGSFIYTEQQDGKTAYQVIKVNQFTGKVTFETKEDNVSAVKI